MITSDRDRPAPRRLSTETKASLKTSELVAYVVTFLLILVAANTIEGKDGGAGYFAGDKVWLYVTLLTIGYMISRGLAKSGTRDPYWAERGDRTAGHQQADVLLITERPGTRRQSGSCPAACCGR